MKKKLVIIPAALAATLSFGTALAKGGADNYAVENQLEALLASEEACNLSYDQSAIEKYVDKNVSDDDKNFSQTIAGGILIFKANISNMTKSELTAHCAHIKRVAKSVGFTN